MHSYGPLHMVVQKQDGQLEPTAALWGFGV